MSVNARVKVCGVTNEADRAAVCTAGTDALGFISGVTVDTPREIPTERAATLVDATPPFVSTVLVTMPETVAEALDRIERVNPDVVQLHATSPDFVAAVARESRVDVLAVVDPTDDDLPAYADAGDALLVDSVDEQGGGGTGQTHDWERTRDLVTDLDVSVVLAGGLTPENVAEAIETVRPYGVDVASGVESEGGVKDHDAVRRFVAAAKDADAARSEVPV